MNVYLTKIERQMLLASARTFYAMDKDYVFDESVSVYGQGLITPKTIRAWRKIINKLKKREAKRRSK